MVLKNYYIWHYLVEARAWDGSDVGNLGMKNLRGMDIGSMYAGDSSLQSGSWYTSMTQWNRFDNLEAHIGSGDNTYTKDAYSLANDITECFSNIVLSRNYLVEDGEYKRLFTITGTNNTANTLTISEIGIVKTRIMYGGYNEEKALFAVAQLAESITVATGEQFKVKVEWIDQ